MSERATGPGSVLEQLFGRERPVIAMMHLPPLPGRPLYDSRAGMAAIVDALRRDLEVLQEGGVDGLLFCNEGDRPYALKIDRAQVAAMAAAIGELRPYLSLPYGVDLLWDPLAALAVAQAVRASFVREVFTGVYDSDMGLWQPDAAAALDYRRQIGAEHIKLFFNIEPEFARPLSPRPIGALARSVVVSSLADAILISGPMAGAEADLSHIREAKAAVPSTPVLANTGVRIETVRATLAVADGVIVGTGLKRDGYTWNPVDPERVRRFMAEVRAAREEA
ncbi:BtpA/SgcQ family protein [Thermogemmatispora tikiterensis]|uniref:SgcQ protein n=1 Tax=Thermogemmatispora tikiterensis TaxID=1825093 RepID=A0A328VEA6_9CHLR|nr:BtpA/SgcQ family protein [Thermogemmatispora tikiterensis]RAQ94352.1 SgcQ protein [Thermogemmatispora tikiterensis]